MGLTYELCGSTLRDRTYGYDAAGRWTRALASPTYDGANQIAAWHSTSFTYDYKR